MPPTEFRRNSSSAPDSAPIVAQPSGAGDLLVAPSATSLPRDPRNGRRMLRGRVRFRQVSFAVLVFLSDAGLLGAGPRRARCRSVSLGAGSRLPAPATVPAAGIADDAPSGGQRDGRAEAARF